MEFKLTCDKQVYRGTGKFNFQKSNIQETQCGAINVLLPRTGQKISTIMFSVAEATKNKMKARKNFYLLNFQSL